MLAVLVPSSGALSELDMLGRFSAILYKEDNFCDLLFAFLYISFLLKKCLVWKKSCSKESLSLPSRIDPFSEGR